jgi:hypothetical protein
MADRNANTAADEAAIRTGEDNGTGGTEGDSAGGVTAQMAAASDIASDSDVGRIGGGLTGGVSTGSAGTGVAGSAIGSGGTGGAEPTDTGNAMGMGAIGTGVGGAEDPVDTDVEAMRGGAPDTTNQTEIADRVSAGSTFEDRVDDPTYGGMAGTGMGETGTRGGGGVGALSGGTGDIGGMGGSSVSESAAGGGGGTHAVGGVGGGPGTIDEGSLGASDEPAGGA